MTEKRSPPLGVTRHIDLTDKEIEDIIDHAADSITPAKLRAIDSPADGEVPTYDLATEKFEWAPAAAGAFAKLFDETVTEAKTQISLTGLDLDADKLYLLEFLMMNNTGSDAVFYMDFNQDTEASHYWVQWLRANGVAISAERENRRSLGWGPPAGMAIYYRTYIMRPYQADYIKCWGGVFVRDPDSIQWVLIGRSWTQTVNLTRIDIISTVADAIGVGSRLMFFKVL